MVDALGNARLERASADKSETTSDCDDEDDANHARTARKLFPNIRLAPNIVFFLSRDVVDAIR